MRQIAGMLLVVVSAAAAAKDPVWLELAPAGQVLARTIVKQTCPSIAVDGKSAAMKARTGADAKTPIAPPAGQRLVCETNVTGAAKVSIGGVALRMPPASPQRIVVLGDTGCRIKVEGSSGSKNDDLDHESEKIKVQDCNDPSDWPFKAVAAAAAASRPDLVIHVGDYVYRESPCPPQYQSDCGGSPDGDNWKTWDADFFTPARALLEAAPWIFVRGNHETCKRSGKGWFYYLDAGPYPAGAQCADTTTPYAVKAGKFHAVVLDSSGAPDTDPAPAQVESFAAQFQLASAAGLSRAWLLTHRPVWAVKAGAKGDRDNLQTLNATLQGAWRKAPIAGVDLVVAGHTHLFELLAFQSPVPTQVVIGIGGTELAHKIKAALAGQSIGGTRVVGGDSVDDFGYALIKASGDESWQLQLYDSSGKRGAVCTLAVESAECSGR